jgi:ring-1,2-phenylacetyl-CoA epoxidase subunit PaaE
MDSILNLEIKDINKDYTDTLCLTLRETNDCIHTFYAGQFITLLINVNGEEVRRGFSIASSPDELPEIMLAIKKVDDGVISTYLYNEIKTGDILKALPPMGNFSVQSSPANRRHLVMFGAGSGITPLFSQLKDVLSNEPESKVTLHYGNRNEASVIYKKELEALQNRYGNRFSIIHYLTQPSEGWDGLTGRINKSSVTDYLNRTEDAVGAKVEYYLCGPEEMMQEIIDILNERSINKKNIHREIYHTTVVDEEEEIEYIPREVTVIFNNEQHKYIIEPDRSILQTALDAGLQLPNSCRYGSCGTCKAKLLSGKLQLINQTALSEEDIDHGYCLTCVGHPASDNVVILYEDQFD